VNAGATPSGLLETPSTPTSFIEMFSYTQPGSVASKRLRVIKTFEYPAGSRQYVNISGDLDSTYTYDTEGKVTTVGYPAVIGGPGPSYAYSFDTLGRPIGLTDNTNSAVVSNVQYGPANELLQMTMTGIGTETRQYNNRLQLVHLSIPGQDLAYTFDTSGHNDGKILNQRDAISGEQVSYLYDSLSRLSSATGSGWSQSYQYDGFGNLLARNATGTAPGSTFAVDPATNRLGGYAYDNNGNLLSVGYQYDAENRLIQANSGGAQYFYDSQNKRIWQGNYAWDDTSGIWNFVSEVFNVYGANGQMLGSYQPQIGYLGSRPNSLTFYQSSARVYFGRKLIAAQDRLGSVGRYYPYGEERNSPPAANDQVKFATYTRDAATGLDYADQRYYISQFGRFMNPDPYKASAGPGNPESWNRYAYAESDPINYNDPKGLFVCPATGCGGDDDDPGGQDAGETARGVLGAAGLSADASFQQLFLKPKNFFGGGGGGPSRQPIPVKAANTELKDAFARLKNCAKIFGGVGRVDSYVDQMKFLDGAGPGSMGLAGDQGNSASFAQYHANYPSVVATTLLTSAGKASNIVVLWADFFGNVAGGHPTSTDDQQGTLIHEFIHSYFNLTDPSHSDVVDKFHIQLGAGESDTQAIDRWISQDCKN
jgi:RHS repeat-associated protein